MNGSSASTAHTNNGRVGGRASGPSERAGRTPLPTRRVSREGQRPVSLRAEEREGDTADDYQQHRQDPPHATI
jgi:hypothetical protein